MEGFRQRRGEVWCTVKVSMETSDVEDCGRELMQTIFRRKTRAHFPEIAIGTDCGSKISSVSSQRLGRYRSTRKLLAAISGLAAIFAFSSIGCQSYHSETLPSASGQEPGLLSPGDTIKISFTTAPELNQSQRI